jgi:hypothetical protein
MICFRRRKGAFKTALYALKYVHYINSPFNPLPPFSISSGFHLDHFTDIHPIYTISTDYKTVHYINLDWITAIKIYVCWKQTGSAVLQQMKL